MFLLFLTGLYKLIIKLHQPQLPQPSAVQDHFIPGRELLFFAFGTFSPIYLRVGLLRLISHILKIILNEISG